MWKEDKQQLLWLMAVVSVHAMILVGIQKSSALMTSRIEPPVILGMMLQDVAAAGAALPKTSVQPPSQKVTHDKHSPKKAETSPAPISSKEPESPKDDVASAGNEGVGNGDISLPSADARQLNNLKPVYPTTSRRLGEEGRVLLWVHVMEDGSVREVKIKRSSGFARLDRSAIKSVKYWQYIPANQKGKPIPFWFVQPIVFSLKTG